MYKVVLAAVLALTVMACGGPEDQTTPETPDVVEIQEDTINPIDTIQIKEDPNRPRMDVADFLGKVDREFELPLTIDSAWMERLLQTDEEISLDYNMNRSETAHLSFNWVEGNETGNSSRYVQIFEEMDSINQLGEEVMDEYLYSLDLGMTRYSTCNSIGKVTISEVSSLIFWSTDYSTIEACPYGYGTSLYATLFTKDVATNTVLVGEMSGGGDPPVWASNYVSSTITDSSITIVGIEHWGEEDFDTGEEIIETNSKTAAIEITPYGMVVSGDTSK